MKYWIITFGCQMNYSDSERIMTVLEKMGYELSNREEEADLIVVNMCSVRQSAVNRIHGLSEKFETFRKKNSNFKAVLTGCILESEFEKFKSFFDYILPIKTLPYWNKYITHQETSSHKKDGQFPKESYYYYPDQRDEKFNDAYGIEYFKIPPKHSTNFRAFIPISAGCDNFCSFCVVPFCTRGPEISRNPEEIIEEAKTVAQKGYKEICLLGQNVNSYKATLKNGEEVRFANLLRKINEIEGHFWIRYLSSNIKDFSQELVESTARSQKVVPYINLPLQAGNEEVLKRMNRFYTISEYKDLVERIRSTFKKHREGSESRVAISTDIIVGFPQETEEQFQDTIKVFEEVKFDMAYIARFSPRPGTPAARMKDDVSEEEKKRREEALTEILKKTAYEKNKEHIGETTEALIDTERKGALFGKSRHYKTVKIDIKENQISNPSEFIGKLVKIKILKATTFGLKAEIL